ncbi:MAG: pilus assembly protein TadG-related protein [Pseudomonadota bacterium]
MRSFVRRNWAAAERGHIIVFFSLVLLPMLAAVGMAIDVSRQVSADRHLQYTIDAAAMAGARALEDQSLSDVEIAGIANAVFEANVKDLERSAECAAPTVSVDRDNTSVSIEANCSFATLFGVKIQGVESLRVGNKATAKADLNHLELALAIDLSSSMEDRIDEVRTAAKTMASMLLEGQSGDRVRLGFVGYGDVVNAGKYGNLALGRTVLDDRDANGVDRVCVTQRSGLSAFTDDAPLPGRYVGAPAPFVPCVVEGLLPLTSDLATFNNAIDALEATGLSTGGHLGVAWSWYLISPNWRLIWPTESDPRGYHEANTIKSSVILTDGLFNVVWNTDFELDQSPEIARNLCAEMRDSGVHIFTISFQAPPDATPLLRDCAGQNDRFFRAETASDLNAVFNAIASELIDLRLGS